MRVFHSPHLSEPVSMHLRESSKLGNTEVPH
jgi:hypothetical protein